MRLKITYTTDNKFLGFEFEDSFPLLLPNGVYFNPSSAIQVSEDNFRLITSNYIIDCITI